MKSKFYWSVIAVTLVAIAGFYLYTSTSAFDVLQNFSESEIIVKDVVTGEPIPGVVIGFSFASSCHMTDEIRGGYDYSTCDGKYNPITSVVTNKQGVALPDISITNHPPKIAVRYFIEDAPGYHPTRSYGLSYHDTVWLVPLDAPLESKEAAIAYLEEQDSVQEIFDFYETRNIEGEYLYAEEEAWYGVWRVTINLSGEIIRNRSLTILVHPDASQYVICNPEYQRTTGTTKKRFAEMNKERDFIKTFPESHQHEFGDGDGCDADLLLK